jgi:hypothetical protein
MTDDNIIRLPAGEDAPTQGDAPDEPSRDRGPHQQPSEQEPNPLFREGPDAPDAADIEDPGEQL